MRRFITVDLDSTLYDTDPREQFEDNAKPRDYAEYEKLLEYDELIKAVRELCLMAMYADYDVYFVTGRSEAVRVQTEERLRADSVPFNDVFMDEDGGDHIAKYGSHAKYKAMRIEKLIEDLDGKHVFHVDDYASVKRELEERGILCICVKTPREVLEGR